MATAIVQSFKNFLTNLEITDRQVSLISTRRENVVKSLKNGLDLHPDESRLIWSYDRNTMIKYLSEGDVDVMVILHYGKNKDYETSDGTTKILDKMKTILDASYPDTVKRRDRNCITMTFSEFDLDVVPAFKYNQWYYTIPDSVDKEWIKTDPTAFAGEITEVNKNMDWIFVPIIKMIKAWNRNNWSVLKGFHIECLLYDHYKNYKQAYSYSSTLKIFFWWLKGKLISHFFDPIHLEIVDDYLDNVAIKTNREIAKEKANKAKEISEEAYRLEENGYIEQSIKKRKELFWDFFPNYW